MYFVRLIAIPFHLLLSFQAVTQVEIPVAAHKTTIHGGRFAARECLEATKGDDIVVGGRIMIPSGRFVVLVF